MCLILPAVATDQGVKCQRSIRRSQEYPHTTLELGGGSIVI